MKQAILMTKEKRHDVSRVVHDRSRGLLRPVNHDNRQTESPRREKFGKCCAAAAVLGYDHLDRFLAQELFLCFGREGATPQDDFDDAASLAQA